jgi:hypothetical protein
MNFLLMNEKHPAFLATSPWITCAYPYLYGAFLSHRPPAQSRRPDRLIYSGSSSTWNYLKEIDPDTDKCMIIIKNKYNKTIGFYARIWV